jgi:hypothetical protein
MRRESKHKALKNKHFLQLQWTCNDSEIDVHADDVGGYTDDIFGCAKSKFLSFNLSLNSLKIIGQP